MAKFLDLATLGLALLLLGVLALLSISGMVDPGAAAQRFGVPAAHPSAEFYHAVYRDRNLAVAVAGFVYLFLSMWRALAILTTVAITLPVYDIAALSISGFPVLAVHWATLIGLIVLAILLLRRVRRLGLSDLEASSSG